jgi:hypothetical protein
MRIWLAAGSLAVLALVPSPAAALPVAGPSLSEAAGIALCAQPNSTKGAKRTGPLGWLMRGARDDDDEPARFGMVMSYYLRSPLLTSFFNIVPCPTQDRRLDESAGGQERCALLVVRGREGEELMSVDLPQAGATTSARLRAVISEHQTRGEPFLILQADGELELPAGAIREVRSGGC